MAKEWFVLHTLTGKEMKAQRHIEAQKRELEGDFVGDVLIPTEKKERFTVSKDGKRKKSTVNRKVFPGYVLIHVDLYEDGDRKKPRETVWHFLQNIPGVIGFIGGDRPVPLEASEIEEIRSQVEDRKDKVIPVIDFQPGETVRITGGPFMNFSGAVEEVDPGKGKLKVSVAIFGRSTLVELDYTQVQRQDPQQAALPQA
ncbi:MAG: transcription termination/antitermination protein NusG [Kiritimatiellia bacterium]|jgi:transcriptional antiterminator NusG